MRHETVVRACGRVLHAQGCVFHDPRPRVRALNSAQGGKGKIVPLDTNPEDLLGYLEPLSLDRYPVIHVLFVCYCRHITSVIIPLLSAP